MGLIFLFGTVWFFVLLCVASIAIIVSTELDEPKSWGFWIMGITIGLLYFGGNAESFKSLLTYISQNPGQIILFIAQYLLLGTVWSFIKWYFYLVDRKEYYTKHDYGYNKSDFTVGENKERIMNWMIYWPLSAFWTMINHPVRRAFKWIFNSFEKQYQVISDKVFKDLNEKKK